MAAQLPIAHSLVAAGAALGLAAAPAAAQHETMEERVAARWVQDELRAFSGEAEFRRYMRDVRRAARSRGLWWARTERERRNTIVVTGSRIVRRNASITNVQEPGVDEGDVVKQIGRFLIVLQDGRLFSIDTQADGGSALALADRVNVYRRVPAVADRDEGPDWYDELLVTGNRIVVTGYSYARDVSELAVFRLTPDGRFEREGVFEISSDDYYDSRNYATRLIGDDLLIYTPLDLGRPYEERAGFPTVRRLEPASDGRERGRSRPLIDYRNLYGPLAATLDPTLHSVSICPLGRSVEGRDLACRTRGFIGPPAVRYYVAPSHVYLWVGPESRRSGERTDTECPAAHRAAIAEAERAVVYRIPVAPGDPQAIRVRGWPLDQFSFDEEGGALRAFVRWDSTLCYDSGDDPQQFAFVSLPLSTFSRFAIDAPHSSYAALPPARGYDFANRFTSTHLAYAPLHDYRYDLGEDGRRDYDTRRPAASDLVVVTLARPAEARRLPLDHNIRRLELVGDDLLVGGEAAGEAKTASLSVVELGVAPRIASSVRLPGRSGGEGRSHAFNLLLGPDGSGLFGLPTTVEPDREPDAEEQPSWSLPSDLSFFALDGHGRMRLLGHLASAMPRYWQDSEMEENMLDGEPDEDIVPGYSCEVSCVDWYGNSRPIFTGGRIFGLSATELIEGRLENGRIVELRRLDFARTLPPRR